jgi:hypothetical protein
MENLWTKETIIITYNIERDNRLLPQKLVDLVSETL